MPLTYVPFVLPRSRSNSSRSTTVSSACSRETVGLGMQSDASGLRPTMKPRRIDANVAHRLVVRQLAAQQPGDSFRLVVWCSTCYITTVLHMASLTIAVDCASDRPVERLRDWRRRVDQRRPMQYRCGNARVRRIRPGRGGARRIDAAICWIDNCPASTQSVRLLSPADASVTGAPSALRNRLPSDAARQSLRQNGQHAPRAAEFEQRRRRGRQADRKSDAVAVAACRASARAR